MSLRRVIKQATGQDINICHACYDCDVPLAEEMDVPLGSLVQLALLDDEEALSTRTRMALKPEGKPTLPRISMCS